METVWLFIHIAALLLLAPLLNGVIKWTKAQWQNRRGPTPWQSYYDLAKFLARENVMSEHASFITVWAPRVYFGAHLLAALLIPTLLVVQAPLEFGDLVTVVGLLALARFWLALAGLDSASNFGGMGTHREMFFAALTEPALLLALFALCLPAGTTHALAATPAYDTPWTLGRLLALFALGIVVIAETGRVPIDNPDTHLELTMAHEGMLLDYSGRPLGLLFWGAHLKQLVVVSLLAAFLLPGPALPSNFVAAPLVYVVAYLLKIGLVGVGLAWIESAYAKLRVFKAPELLTAAGLIGLLALVATAGA